MGLPKEHGSSSLLQVEGFYRDEPLCPRMEDEIHVQPTEVPEPASVEVTTVQRRVQVPVAEL